MNSSDGQSQKKYNAENGIRGGGNQCDMSFGHYPGQIGVLVPNPTLGETNFGGINPNMPYGPVYAFPPFPFQHGANQGDGGQWQQQWNGNQGSPMSNGNWSQGGC